MGKVLPIVVSMMLLFSTYSIYSVQGVLGASDDAVESAEGAGVTEEPSKPEPEKSAPSQGASQPTGDSGAGAEKAPAEEKSIKEQPSTQETVAEEPVAEATAMEDGAAEQSQEPDGEPIQASDEEQAEVPFFTLAGELCPSWLAKWKAGTKTEVPLRYTVRASAYDPQFVRCEILAFGVHETKAGLLSNIPSSGRVVLFGEEELSFAGEYVIAKSFLDALPNGEYQAYALYADADGQEKKVVLGTLDLLRPEMDLDAPEEITEEPARSELKDARVVTWTTANEETFFGDIVTAFCEVENLYGWEYTLQWQFSTGQGRWIDIPGARGTSFSFEWTADNSGYSWRVRVDIVVPIEASGEGASEDEASKVEG